MSQSDQQKIDDIVTQVLLVINGEHLLSWSANSAGDVALFLTYTNDLYIASKAYYDVLIQCGESENESKIALHQFEHTWRATSRFLRTACPHTKT